MPSTNAVAPIHAVAISTIHGLSFSGRLATNMATVRPPSKPHRPSAEVMSPPALTARRNHPKAKPPAAATQYFANLKKKMPIAAPMNDEMMQARRYSPRSVDDGGFGDGGWMFG